MGMMPYSFDEKRNLVVLRPSGSIDVQEILEYGSALLDEGVISDGLVEYVDMSGMTNLSVDYNSAQRLVEMHRKWIDHGWIGSLYYTPLDVQFGIVRMVAAMVSAVDPEFDHPMIPLREPTAPEEIRSRFEVEAQRMDELNSRHRPAE